MALLRLAISIIAKVTPILFSRFDSQPKNTATRETDFGAELVIVLFDSLSFDRAAF